MTVDRPPSSSETPQSEQSKPPLAARSNWLFKICYALLLLALLLFTIASVGYFGLENWSERPFGQAGARKVKIAPRTSSRSIATMLQREGLVEYDRLFIVWLMLHHKIHQMQAGEFEIKTPVAPIRLIEILSKGRFERAVTIPEGWTARQIARRLAAEKWIKSEQEWLNLVTQPLFAQIVGEDQPAGAEGFCFPETYRLDEGTSASVILRRMTARFHREWEAADPARRDERSAKLSMLEVVTLASMLERESRIDEELPRIASVYLNRLSKKMKLQCCATVRYALGEVWDRPLTYADLKIASPYNTYLHRGLPPGPIANPGRAAIEAVFRPIQYNELFYVYAGNNHHIFSRTYAEHMKALRQLRQREPQAAVTGQSED